MISQTSRSVCLSRPLDEEQRQPLTHREQQLKILYILFLNACLHELRLFINSIILLYFQTDFGLLAWRMIRQKRIDPHGVC
jgi:hypothetical protein